MRIRAVCHIISVVLVVSAAGCRNQLQELEVNSTDYERTPVENVVLVESMERDLDEGMLRIRVVNHQLIEVKVFEVSATVSRYTPYQWWREFYEIPIGMAMVPVEIGAHLLYLLSCGAFSHSWCVELDCFGMAALNPFLNVESPARFADETLIRRRNEVDVRRESISLLGSGLPVMLRAGRGELVGRSDQQGVAVFSLLDLDGSGPTLVDQTRRIEIFTGDFREAADEWIISRELQARLNLAAGIISAYHAEPSGRALAGCVKKLEELKFIRLAYLLEEEELRRHTGNLEFAAGFSAAIEDLRLPGAAEPVDLRTKNR